MSPFDGALPARVQSLDWPRALNTLQADGLALFPQLLDQSECAALRATYADEKNFRSRIVMERYNFGRGEYRYFADPLPLPVQALRETLYAPLVTAANNWAAALNEPQRFPPAHAQFRAQCQRAGQVRPTPLLLRYGAGDYNCLHQDLYGGIFFPFQVVILLSAPGVDFDGGEFVLVEQRPRMQSRPTVVPLRQGDAAVFAVRHRPAAGRRRSHRVQLRHGVSTIRWGERLALGIIFHDAE